MPPQADPSPRHAGFTLIETIVALAILSAGLIGFYQLLTTILNSANRVQVAAIAYDRQTNALELVEAVNPMEIPEGTFDTGHYHIHWTSKLIGDVRQGSRYPSGPGPFKIGLYRVTLSFPDDEDVSSIDVTRLGYHHDDSPIDMSSVFGASSKPQ
jgi:prepilin-type N-terminal cleavage/methylation domain-containing protein